MRPRMPGAGLKDDTCDREADQAVVAAEHIMGYAETFSRVNIQ